MAFFKRSDLASKRSEPPVWISKLALFESLDPLTPIREPIKFHTGLNIVWGVENEANDVEQQSAPRQTQTSTADLVAIAAQSGAIGEQSDTDAGDENEGRGESGRQHTGVRVEDSSPETAIATGNHQCPHVVHGDDTDESDGSNHVECDETRSTEGGERGRRLVESGRGHGTRVRATRRCRVWSA